MRWSTRPALPPAHAAKQLVHRHRLCPPGLAQRLSHQLRNHQRSSLVAHVDLFLDVLESTVRVLFEDLDALLEARIVHDLWVSCDDIGGDHADERFTEGWRD